MNPGLVCPLCYELTESEAARNAHLSEFHKIEFNFHLAKFESIKSRQISRDQDIVFDRKGMLVKPGCKIKPLDKT